LWDSRGTALTETGILNDYDIVLLDTPPALGYLTINALSAADILLVPLGASFLEFDSTGRFFDMIYSTFASIEEGENRSRRAQGLPEMRFEWDGQAGELVSGIYETDYRDFNRDTYVRGRETFDRTWAEVKQVILGAWWRDLKLKEKG
jgi:chromosome partitioning protein